MNFKPTRREFLKTAGVFSALGVAPQFLIRTVEGAAQQIKGFKDDNVLVVLQLGGGNDGLNTLVPFGDDAYHRARPNLGIDKNNLLPINDFVGFNSRLEGLKRLYDDGNLAILQGVGYPNPDRSHFRSMEIWHTASASDEFYGSGWIGRYFDHACSGTARPQAGVALGPERPQAFDGEKGFGVAFEDPRHFGWQPGQGADNEQNFAKLNAPTAGESNIDFLRHVTSSAILSSKEVVQAADRAGLQSGGSNELSRTLHTVAGLIRGGLDTRIYYVSVSGFDTHANQSGQHDNLLGQVATALQEFQATLRNDTTSSRVLTMVFSEFGRRVAENYSGGTDHGTAAPMFFVGDRVKPGLYGYYPSLSDLDDGDLKHSVDFRSAYASVLHDWFNIESKGILHQDFNTYPIIA